MLVVISSPTAFADEADTICALFDEGLALFHLRKKDLDEVQLRHFIEKLPQEHHAKIMLHSHYHLVDEYGLKGIQVSEHYHGWRPQATLGVSFHSIEAIKTYDKAFDYGFISPVFDSISKDGYVSRFDLNEISQFLSQTEQTILALGGIDEDKIDQVKQLGFKGFALLGAIWQSDDPIGKFRRIKQKWQSQTIVC